MWKCTGSIRPARWHWQQVGTPKDEWRCHFGRLDDHDTLMECLPIDFISRLQIGSQQAVLPLQAIDHRPHIVASLHDVMVPQHG
jgi:hypothetical protein